MKKQTQKQKRRTKSLKSNRIGKIMVGLADNPEFILHNILKAMKG